MKLYTNKDLQVLWGIKKDAVYARLRQLRDQGHKAFVVIDARTWALRLKDDDAARALRPNPPGRPVSRPKKANRRSNHATSDQEIANWIPEESDQD